MANLLGNPHRLRITRFFGSPSNLVLKAHQQGGLKIFTRSSSGFVVRVHSSTIPVAPKVLKSQVQLPFAPRYRYSQHGTVYQGVKQSKRGVHLDQDKKSCYTRE